MYLSTNNLSPRSREYFGGDVQRFWIEREPHKGVTATKYSIWQQPHWLNKREVAIVYAFNLQEAIEKFDAIAYFADTEHL